MLHYIVNMIGSIPSLVLKFEVRSFFPALTPEYITVLGRNNQNCGSYSCGLIICSTSRKKISGSGGFLWDPLNASHSVNSELIFIFKIRKIIFIVIDGIGRLSHWKKLLRSDTSHKKKIGLMLSHFRLSVNKKYMNLA